MIVIDEWEDSQIRSCGAILNQIMFQVRDLRELTCSESDILDCITPSLLQAVLSVGGWRADLGHKHPMGRRTTFDS